MRLQLPTSTYRTLASLALASAAAGCGDATGPARNAKVDVTVTVDGVDGPVLGRSGSAITFTCTVFLRAVALGPGTARWDSATFQWFAGKDRSSPVGTEVVSASDVGALWGDSTVHAFSPQTTAISLTISAPYAVTIDFLYRAEAGRQKKTSVHFACGPEITAATPPPEITSLAVMAPGGDFEPGQRLTMTWAATSTVGLLSTSVHISGPCDITLEFSESLQRSTTRTADEEIPPNCLLGVPFTVTAFAQDAALQTSSRQTSTQIVLVDKTPPALSVLLLPRFNLTPRAPLGGTYFVGDTIELQLTASDNHALSAVVWEVQPAGLRDSIRISTTTLNQKIRIPVRPEWVGFMDIRLFARDAMNLVSPAVASLPNAFQILPDATRPTATATVHGEIREAVIDTARDAAYLVQSNEGRVAVFSLSSMQVSSTLAMPDYPVTADLSPSGDSLIVGLQSGRALAIVDLTRPQSPATLLPLTALDPLGSPEFASLRTMWNGKVFVIVSGRVLEVDLTTGSQRFRADAGRAGTLDGGDLERSADHSTLMINQSGCGQRYEVATDRFETCVFVPSNGTQLSLTADGRRFSIGSSVYDSGWHLVKAMDATEYQVSESWLTPDGSELHEWLGGIGFLRARVSDGRLLDRTRYPFLPTFTLLSPDGRWLVLIDSNHQTTSRVGVIQMR